MAATKLRIYQDAARLLGDARFALITDDVETRYAMDDAWDECVVFVLRQAAWEFAVKTAALVAGGGVAPGYTTAYAYPTNWLRTHAIYIAQAGRELPFDLKELNRAIQVNISTVPTMRYVDSRYADPSFADWPEHFAQCVAAYLAFLVAERVTGESGAATRMSQLFASLLPEAVTLDAIPEDRWLPHQRSGIFLRVARSMVDEGLWRFALKTDLQDLAGVGEGGLTYRFTIPDDWAQTRSLYRISTSGQRRPFDVRERSGGWHTNATSFYAEYVSASVAMDAREWPDIYMQAVLRRLELEAGGAGGESGVQNAAALAEAALMAARRNEAEDPDPWLRHQFSGVLARCIPAVISKGYWRFALKMRQYSAEADQDAVPTDGAYPYRFTLPDDWFKTHAIFIPCDGAECPLDAREREGHWYTATASFMARYVSTAALDPINWPDSLAKAVQAYLDLETAPEEGKKNAAAVWVDALDSARTEWSQPENQWLRFQLDGSYWETVKFVLAAGRWRGAIKTVTLTANATMGADGTITGTEIPTGLGDGTISPSYSAVFTKPGDWYRTIWVYRVNTAGPQVNSYYGWPIREDIDFRDEGGSWHTNWDTITVRYLSRDGLAGTRAPPSFRNAVQAWLQYEEARHEPKMAGVAATKLQFYKDLLQTAEDEDDERERAPVNNFGRFVRARLGRCWIDGRSIGVAASAGTVLTDDSGNVILTP